MSRFYTVSEVASIFHVKPPTIYTWIKNGKLEYVRVGRLIRITEQHLAAFLESGVVNTTPMKAPGIAEAGV
jgi:excisionase family DNA binding protein